MAFWAKYKLSWFPKKRFPNMIKMYKEYLYDQWYTSLSEDERIAYEKKERQKRKNALNTINLMMNMFNHTTSSKNGYFYL